MSTNTATALPIGTDVIVASGVMRGFVGKISSDLTSDGFHNVTAADGQTYTIVARWIERQFPLPVHEQIRAMRVRAANSDRIFAHEAQTGDVIKVPGEQKGLVRDYHVNETGTLVIEVFTEDAQIDTMYVATNARITRLHSASARGPLAGA